MDLFDLVAKLTLDSKDYEDKIEKSEKKTSKFANSIKTGLVNAAKAGAAALAAMGTAAAAATAKMVKDAVAAYADYEQLAGGVETLFGDSAQKVIADSQAAFRTAGMSVNEYMETSIQSAGALIKALDGDQERAAEIMNMSIVDMADNVNKMGTSMEAVQNAYRGFSRGNFTMLDNLALGFAGTKEGMEELLARAEELSGVHYDISNYADIVEAIHVVQTDMGIAGTTAKEASETISGSLASAKSAWQNLMVGLADGNADISSLAQNFVESVKTVGKNIIPVVKTALNGVGTLISELAPIIAKELPGLIKDILPDFIKTIKEMFPALIDAALMLLDTLVDAITDNDNIDSIVDAGIQLVSGLAKGFQEAAPTLLRGIVKLIKNLAVKLKENIRPIFKAISAIIREIANLLKDPNLVKEMIMIFVDLAIEIGKAIIAVLPSIISSIGDILSGLLGGLWLAIQEIFKQISPWIDENVIQPVLGFFKGLWAAISNFASGALEAIKGGWKSVTGWFDSNIIQPVKNAFSGAWKSLSNGASAAWTAIKNTFTAIPEWFKSKFKEAWQGVKNIFSTGGQIFAGITEGIVSAFKKVVNAIITGINTVIAVPFNTINGLLNKIRSIEILGLKPFISLWSRNPLAVPQIPLLAKGGIIDKPTLAMLGEAGKEAVVPLENNTEWTKKVAEEIANGMRSNNQDELSEIRATLKAILANMGVDIVLNDGVIAGRVDRILGRTTTRKARGNA